MTIGEKIKKYRKITGVTQQELAEFCEINVATIKKYELGQRNPKPDQISKIAKGFGVNPFVFYDFEINSAGDVMSLLFLISDATEMKFEITYDKEDELAMPDVAIRFTDTSVSGDIAEWSEFQQVIDSMKNNELLESRGDIRNAVDEKISEMESEFRHRIMEDNREISYNDLYPLMDLPYIMMDDGIEAERLGMPLMDYLYMKDNECIPSSEEED